MSRLTISIDPKDPKKGTIIAGEPKKKKPKFYQSTLTEIKGDVLLHVYPKNGDQLTMTERMGSEEALCPDCGKNHWWLYPKEGVAFRTGGKPYIECINCGYITHL